MGYRLDKGGHVDRSQPIHFRWNGRSFRLPATPSRPRSSPTTWRSPAGGMKLHPAARRVR